MELADCYLNHLFKVKYELQLHQAIVTNIVDIENKSASKSQKFLNKIKTDVKCEGQD